MTHIVPRRTLQDIHLKKADIDDIVPMSDPSSQARAVLSHSPGPGEVWGKPPRPGRTVGYLPGAPDGPTSRRRAPPNAARASRAGGGASRRRPDVRGTSEQGPPPRSSGRRPARGPRRPARSAGRTGLPWESSGGSDIGTCLYTLMSERVFLYVCDVCVCVCFFLCVGVYVCVCFHS